MRLLRGAIHFYRRLFLPSLLVAMAFGAFSISLIGEFGAFSIPLTGEFANGSAALAYLIFSPVFHYLVYDVYFEDEYYFYYNLGLSRRILWGFTVVFGLLMSLLFVVI